MKGKLRFMWRATLALVLVLSLGVIMAAPVAALEPLATPTLVLSSYVAEEEDVQHTISFDIALSLGVSDEITIVFNTTYVTPPTVADDEVTLDSVGIGGAVTIDAEADKWVITLAEPLSTATNPVVVVITSAAQLNNPEAATDYTLSVETSKETATSTAEYTIIALPEVTGVVPASGNVDDTMWVEVTGTDFTGTTTLCTTEFDFGDGVEVVDGSYHWIDAEEIDCQITINTAGAARDVIPTSTAGEGTNTSAQFDPNATGTAQVDVWGKYTPADAILNDNWDTDTLVFDDDEGNPFATIQGAEDVCTVGTETVIVHADTYAESLVIDKAITLLALTDVDTTIIDGESAVLIVSVTAGATIDGFTIQGDATTTNQAGILVNGASVDGFAIQNNKFVDIAGGNLEVLSDAGAIDGGLIDTNTLTGLGADAQGPCILVKSGSNNNITGVTISDNTISNFNGVDACEWPGIQVSKVPTGGAVTNIAITGNTISNGATGIKITGGVTGLTGSYAIAGNTISGQTEAGVSADDISPATDWPVFDLENNIITSCLYGIELGSGSTDHTIKYNDISGNSWGLLVGGTQSGTITAKYNWWGDISGPSSGSQLTPVFTWWSDKVSDALGSGDAMSTNVDTYDPWLTETQAKTVEDGIAYFGSTTPLQEGWNTLSVPLALKDSANTMADIMALGDFLTDTNWEIAYQYKPATPTAPGCWENIGTNPIDLAPCRGYYIKILGTADVSFPVLYNGQLGLPALELDAGWNLIGSGFGIDKTDSPDGDYGIAGTGKTDGMKKVNVALDSIKAKCSVVVSPTMPGQTVTAGWAVLVGDAEKDMIVGEAYWVFMTDSATLAGFEITPIYYLP